ncbi:MAG: amino acid racemase [Caulobacteraceae bacterium]|nr:amino acid racemase [Caulobacteraceae bacterium]
MSKVVGVIGGMGPAATLEFQGRLLAATPAARDQDHLRLLIDCNPGIPDRNRALAGEGPSPAPVLAAMARGLEAQGAELLVMPCNTAHAFAEAIQQAVDIPLINLIDVAADAAVEAAAGAEIGVLAVDGARAAGLYDRALAERGRQAVYLDVAAQARFMTMIYAIKAGDTGPDVKATAAGLAAELQRAGAAAVISACTELALVLTPADLSIPLIDSTGTLVRRTLERALEPDA